MDGHSRTKQTAALINRQKHVSLKINQPLLGDKVREKASKTRSKINSKISNGHPVEEDDGLYNKLQ